MRVHANAIPPLIPLKIRFNEQYMANAVHRATLCGLIIHASECGILHEWRVQDMGILSGGNRSVPVALTIAENQARSLWGQ